MRLELTGISAAYGDTLVLRDINLIVPSGKVVALLGPNGAGKTTLLSVVSGLLGPRSGRVLLDRHDRTATTPEGRAALGVCHVTEGGAIFPGLTVAENLRMFAPAKQRHAAEERVVSAFPKLGQRMQQIAGTMSGGEQRMLALARAYARRPSLILLDEISLGLAPIIVDEIFAFLGQLASEGTSLLVVEQYVSKVLALADLAFLLVRGGHRLRRRIRRTSGHRHHGPLPRGGPGASRVSGSLAGRAALVTGGGSGIGLGCARRLAAEGAAVTIAGRSLERLEAAVEAIGSTGGCVRHVVCDVTDESQVEQAVAAASGPDGRLDMAVVNAGGGSVGPVLSLDATEWDRMLAVNLTGSLFTIKHAARAMLRDGGSIVAISSIAGRLTHRYMAAYATSKAALEMLVRSAADELGPARVRVNAIRPGLVPTDATVPLVADDATVADYLAQMPLGRVGTVDDIAAAVAFFCRDESAWITGQVLAVDGGHTLRRGPDISSLAEPIFGGLTGGVPG